MMMFYPDNTLVNSFDKIRREDFSFERQIKKLNQLKLNDNNNATMSVEEHNFMEFFRGTIKYISKILYKMQIQLKCLK